MTKTTYFTSTNDEWILESDGDRFLGWCAAGSALWCHARLSGKALTDSAPSQLRSGLLHAIYLRDDDTKKNADDRNLLKNVGVAARNAFGNTTLENLLKKMTKQPGVYFFCNDCHAMACDTRGGNFYWYDREEGCFGFDDAKEFTNAVRDDYKTTKTGLAKVFRKRVWYAVEATGLAA